VDLNLDSFNLSAPSTLTWQDRCAQLRAGADISRAFWANVDNGPPSLFKEEDRTLLRKVFNCNISDRRKEGDRFIPPDTSFAYLQKLRSLVKEEESLQKRRKDHFFSQSFEMDAPGLLFPLSWASSLEIFRKGATAKRSCSLRAYLDKKSRAQALKQALKSVVPVFDKSTEDGTRLRIYRILGLEVRTAQEHDGLEAIGAVFSRRASARPPPLHASIQSREQIVKATEYIEKTRKGFHPYMVLETELNNKVVIEKYADGRVKREENPENLDVRNSWARVTQVFSYCLFGRTAECLLPRSYRTTVAG